LFHQAKLTQTASKVDNAELAPVEKERVVPLREGIGVNDVTGELAEVNHLALGGVDVGIDRIRGKADAICRVSVDAH